jgi:chaperonin GroES
VAKKNKKPQIKNSAKSKTNPKAKPKTKPKMKVKTKAKTVARVSKTKGKPAVKASSKALRKAAQPKSDLKAVTKRPGFSGVLKPLDNRVIVRHEEFAQRTPGGLFIPETVTYGDRHKQGEVVAVGRGHVNKKGQMRPLDVQKGDTVIFNGYAGAEVKVDGTDFVILTEDEILGVIRP